MPGREARYGSNHDDNAARPVAGLGPLALGRRRARRRSAHRAHHPRWRAPVLPVLPPKDRQAPARAEASVFRLLAPASCTWCDESLPFAAVPTAGRGDLPAYEGAGNGVSTRGIGAARIRQRRRVARRRCPCSQAMGSSGGGEDLPQLGRIAFETAGMAISA